MTQTEQRIIMHFGEMGSHWGISRTVGQMYALLILNKEPLCADDFVEELNISRSNVSMGLKELHAWNLIQHHRKSGDRKDYYYPPEDMWEIVRILIEERRKREIEPTLTMLRTALMDDDAGKNEDRDYAHSKMQQMHDVIELFVTWSSDIQKLDTRSLQKLMKLGRGVNQVLNMGRKLRKTS